MSVNDAQRRMTELYIKVQEIEKRLEKLEAGGKVTAKAAQAKETAAAVKHG